MSSVVNSFRRLSITPQKNKSDATSPIPPSTTKRALKAKYNDAIIRARQFEKAGDDYDSLYGALHSYKRAYSIFNHDRKLAEKIKRLEQELEEQFEEVEEMGVENRDPNPIVLDTPDKRVEERQITRPLQQSSRISANHAHTQQPLQRATTSLQKSSRFTILPDGFIHDSQHDVYRLSNFSQSISDPLRINPDSIPYKLPASIYKKLYPYQRDGIRWFWKKHCESSKKVTSGGILGDDMGLGKTVQVAAYLAGLFNSKLVEHVMIGMPVSVLQNWRKEFDKWAPKLKVYMFHQITKKQREYMLADFAETGGILLTTYGMITSQTELFETSFSDYGYRIDYIFLDEGHKVKNPSIQLSISLRKIAVGVCRFILTGTPVQNNLMEMWALFDYLFEGRLLGEAKSFKSNFEKNISRSQEKDATDYEKQLGTQLSEKLRTIIDPYFLRREKSVVLNSSSSVSISKKNDLICWITIAERQRELYSDFLESSDVRAVLNKSQSALAALTILKQLCNHPNLLSQNQQKTKRIKDMVEESGKLKFLQLLLKQLYVEKHRVLIFSQSVQMLNIISKLLDLHCYSHLQIDGSITDSRERQRLIDEFNAKDSKHFCFLLTSQVGGFGITLTSADRVVIFDPSWNPAVDSQAVDRAYRIGQTKNVIVYRLITCGTIEEKIYRKQVFKGALSKQTIEQSTQHRYFTHSELRELFKLGNTDRSDTMDQLREFHQNVAYYPEFNTHIDTIKRSSSGIMCGFSDHDLVFSKRPEDKQADSQSSIAAQQSVNKIMQSSSTGTSASNPVLLSPPASSKKRSEYVPPTPYKKKRDFSGNELDQLLKGIRMYGEDDKWGLINVEFLPDSNFTAIVLQGAWEQFKKGKSKRELIKLLSKYDDEFDVLPPFPALSVESDLSTEKETITIDDDDDEIEEVSVAPQSTVEEVLEEEEPIESVCRRVSMGLGLLGNPDFGDEEETEDEPHPSKSDNESDDELNDSFLVSDDDQSSTNGEDNYEDDLEDGNDDDEEEYRFEDDEENEDIDMRERTPFSKSLNRNLVMDFEADEQSLEAEQTPRLQPTKQSEDMMDTAEDWTTPHRTAPSPITPSKSFTEEEDSPVKPTNAEYVQLVREARSFELQGHPLRALALYMRAVEFDDTDSKLHCKICALAQRLNIC